MSENVLTLWDGRAVPERWLQAEGRGNRSRVAWCEKKGGIWRLVKGDFANVAAARAWGREYAAEQGLPWFDRPPQIPKRERKSVHPGLVVYKSIKWACGGCGEPVIEIRPPKKTHMPFSGRMCWVCPNCMIGREGSPEDAQPRPKREG